TAATQYVEDGKGGEVDNAGALTQAEVLGVDDGRPPARIPFGLARHDALAILCVQRLVGLVPLRALPAGRLEEDGAQRFFAVVKRAAAHVAVRRPLLARVDDAVGLVEA